MQVQRVRLVAAQEEMVQRVLNGRLDFRVRPVVVAAATLPVSVVLVAQAGVLVALVLAADQGQAAAASVATDAEGS